MSNLKVFPAFRFDCSTPQYHIDSDKNKIPNGKGCVTFQADIKLCGASTQVSEVLLTTPAVMLSGSSFCETSFNLLQNVNDFVARQTRTP